MNVYQRAGNSCVFEEFRCNLEIEYIPGVVLDDRENFFSRCLFNYSSDELSNVRCRRCGEVFSGHAAAEHPLAKKT